MPEDNKTRTRSAAVMRQRNAMHERPSDAYEFDEMRQRNAMHERPSDAYEFNEASANIFGTSKIIRTEITYVTSRI
jgi:hypothetical protein